MAGGGTSTVVGVGSAGPLVSVGAASLTVGVGIGPVGVEANELINELPPVLNPKPRLTAPIPINNTFGNTVVAGSD